MFWKNFSKLCAKTGKSASAVAKECGLSSGITSQWKSEKKSPSGKTLEKLASYFGVSVDYLLNGEDTAETLSAIEKRAVDLLRQMSPDMQQRAIGRLEEMLHQESVAADPNLKQAK